MNIHFCIENEELLHKGQFFEFFKEKVDIMCKDNGSDFVLSFYQAVDTLELFFSLLYLMESRGVKVKLDNPTSIATYHFELKDDQFVVDYYIGQDLEDHYEAPVPYQSFKNELETSLHAYLEGVKKINPELVNDPIYQGLARCQINREWFSNYCEMIADSFRRANREVPVGDEFFHYHIVKK